MSDTREMKRYRMKRGTPLLAAAGLIALTATAAAGGIGELMVNSAGRAASESAPEAEARYDRPAAAAYATLSALLTNPAPIDSGFVITNREIISTCSGCHQADSEGRLGRISYMRKTPEGWQTSIVRMIALYGVELEPTEAREIVRYLSNNQGLAPDELEDGRFESELRTIEYTYAASEPTETTCNACHSMGRVITQRRTEEEWRLLSETHRALYPLIDNQRFRRSGPPAANATGEAADRRHPVDRAIEHLAEAFPLETASWAAWSANMRDPQLEGTWTLSGYDPAMGPVHGTVVIRPVDGRNDEFTSETRMIAPESGKQIRRTGRSIVYTGYQWRGRSTAPGDSSQYREVMVLERGSGEMTGRWFTGEYGELGLDVTLKRVTALPVVSTVYPTALGPGANQEVRVYGSNLSTVPPGRVSFGTGVTVRSVSQAEPGVLLLRVDVAEGAAIGRRDLTLADVSFSEALAVYDEIDAIRVEPFTGMARTGGQIRPRQFMQYEAVAYHDGPDGKAETDDDLKLMRVPATWSMDEYPETFEDDDIRFVGTLDQNGFFTPAGDGPNAERSGNRNNIGTVYVVASYTPPGSTKSLTARSHLLVTVPNYITFDPWTVTSR